MPELPEVETVRRTLGEAVLGRLVSRVTIHRKDIVRGSATTKALGSSSTVQTIERHGKQLAIVTDAACVCVHLGMSGSLRVLKGNQKPPIHTHITWRLDDGNRFVFADPRRFGGLWTFNSLTTLRNDRWSRLGPDPPEITPSQLHRALSTTTRPIKAALLDQHLVAGLGNIYVDEVLFQCRLHPLAVACDLELADAQRLVRAMRKILADAIAAGGTTLRDYVDGAGRTGGWQKNRQVHGRSGQDCLRCGSILETSSVGGRTTISCPTCQRQVV